MPDSTHFADVAPAAFAGGRASILPLAASGVGFEVNGRRLIDGLELRLERDTLTVILGPNGAGKSLTLRLLHGLLQPSAGTIRYAGRPIDRAVRLRQAMVFQRPVLLRRSALANVRFALRARGEARTHVNERALAALRRAGLDGLADRSARVLSAGEQQRLALARAMSLRPDVLFLDEPAANLDPAATLAIEGQIRAARRDGTKIVLVTHDLGQARRLAEEVVFIHRGRVTEHSPAERFFSSPASTAARAHLEHRLVL
jgi:tungstate transport system ATP-binding protein